MNIGFIILIAILGGLASIVVSVLIISAIVNFVQKQNKAADETIKQTSELKRANDLKDKELKIREEEIKLKKRKRKK